MSHQGHYYGAWSAWKLTEDQTRHYRERQDENGTLQYEYSSLTQAADPSVPRGDDTGLENAFGNVSLNDPYGGQYHYHHGYGQGPYEYTATEGGSGGAGVGTASGAQPQHYSTSSPQGQVSSSRKGKGVDTGTRSKKSSRDPHKEKKKESSSSRRQHGSKQEKDAVDRPTDPFYGPASMEPFYEPKPSPPTEYRVPGIANVAQPTYPGADEYSDPSYYPDNVQAAQVEESYAASRYPPEPEQSGHRSQRHPKEKHSKPSSSGKNKQPLSSYPEDSEGLQDGGAGDDPYNPGAGGWPHPEEELENLTPRAGSPQPDLPYEQALQPDSYASQPGTFASQPDIYYPSASSMPSHAQHSSIPSYAQPSSSQFASDMFSSSALRREAIQGDTGEQYGDIDDRYVIEQSSRFAPGEVFKILWSEPRGGKDEDVSVEEREDMGRKFYIGFRRFIVVANDEGHCTCVPILTYERRACTKKGVKPQKHGIVYSMYSRPQRLPKEPVLGFDPVRLELDYSTERLAKESRVNYSKLVTVEHNVSVFFIGRIVAEDFDIVTNAVDKCWAEKYRSSGGGGESSHHRRRHGR